MNKKLPTISIKGKEYVQVKDRVVFFNETYKNGMIKSEILLENPLRIKATVIPDVKNPDRYFTGYSEIVRDVAKPLGTPQMLETVETSAVGRALAMLGIGIIESVASADELVKAGVPVDPTVKLGICETCGKTAMISTKPGHRQYCPDWKIHKSKGEASNIIFPPPPLSKKEEEFVSELTEEEEIQGLSYGQQTITK